MPSPATIHPAAVVPESQRAALLNLLADDDPAIYHTIRDKILSFGETARDWLRPHTLSSDPVLRRREQEIIRHFDRAAADNRFLAFCLGHGEEFINDRPGEPEPGRDGAADGLHHGDGVPIEAGKHLGHGPPRMDVRAISQGKRGESHVIRKLIGL